MASPVDNHPRLTPPTQLVLRSGAVAVLVMGIVGGALILYGQWQNQRQPARVEAAVHATFPQFCAQPGEQLSLEREILQLPWQYDRWTVACQPSPFPWREAVMVVDLSTCRADPPMMATDEGHHYYGDMYGRGQKLAVCP